MSKILEVQDRVLQLLREGGWNEKAGRPDFVSKGFDTAVGRKRASAWCVASKGEGTEGTFYINGEYLSEGNNALANCIGYIPKDADDAAIAAVVQGFLDQAQHSIEESYAMKLDRPRDR